MRKKVLFVCTHNSARSQMAEALLNHLHGDRFQAFSAGTIPTEIHPYTREVLVDIGIDISSHRAKSIDEFITKGMEFDLVVTVCDNARESCPHFPGGKKRLHKSFEDPSQVRGTNWKIMEAFRMARGEIKEWIEEEFILM